MKTLISFLCVFMYFMSPYRLAGHELPEIIGMLAILLAFIVGFRLHFEKSYALYLVYMWIIPPIAGLLCGISGNYMQALIPVALILSSLYLGLILPSADKGYVLRFYRILVYIAVGFFVVQEIFYNLTGFRPTLYLSFLEMYYEGSDEMSLALSRAEMDRSSSFFLKPSHFVQYIIPYFCIVISKYINEKKGLSEVLIMLFVIIWLKAGIGLVSLLVIGCFFFLKSGVLKMYQRVLVVFTTIVLFAFITTIYKDTALVAYIMERSSEFSMEVDIHGPQSGFIRIWRGYFIYGAMDIVNQILGVSPAGMEAVSNAVYIPGCRYEGPYMNGVQTLLVSGGVIGCILFFKYIIHIYKQKDITGRCILVAMITIFFMEHMLNTPKMFLYILLASCFNISSSLNNKKQLA